MSYLQQEKNNSIKKVFTISLIVFFVKIKEVTKTRQKPENIKEQKLFLSSLNLSKVR